jgi:hypothetical protein
MEEIPWSASFEEEEDEDEGLLKTSPSFANISAKYGEQFVQAARLSLSTDEKSDQTLSEVDDKVKTLRNNCNNISCSQRIRRLCLRNQENI